MKRRQPDARDSLTRLFQQATEAWRKQEYQVTIETLERAGRMDSSNPSIQLDLARAHGLRYDYPSAGRCLEKAVRLGASKTQILAAAGARCQEFGNYGMAKQYFERAVAQDEKNAEALVTLAELLEHHHEMSQASQLVSRALKTQPRNSRARVAQARLLRLGGQFDEAEAGLRELIANQSCDPSNRIRAWYELGYLLDRQNRFSEAMSAFLEAKALQRPAAVNFSAVLEGIQSRVREMEKTITADTLKRWSSASGDLLPMRQVAILCGHPRSGTTLLEQVLDSHPGIVAAEETHILHDEAYLPLSRGFSTNTSILEVLDSATATLLRKSREDYFSLTELFIGKTIGDRLLVDKNPALNVLIPAVVRIFPEAKFLVALRDPRDVCLSCFMQPLALNPVSSAYLTLEGTVKQYASVMAFWRSLLPRLPNPWMEVRYENLVQDLEGTTRQTLKFLDQPWNPEVLKFHEHARNKPVRSPTYAEVVKPVHNRAVGRWTNYQTHLEPFFEKLQPFLDAFGYT